MSGKGYNSIMRVTTEASLPTTAKAGQIAYCEDTMKHYLFQNSVWVKVTDLAGKVYDNGTLKTGPFIRWYKTVTTLSGNVTYYPTADGTSTGTALFVEIFSNSVQTQTQDGTSVYAPGAVTVAGNLKSVAVAYTKQVFSGIVLLSTNLLGSVTNSAIPDGISIRGGFEGR